MMQKRLPGAARERITVGEDIRGADINALIHLICHMPENLVGLELGTYRGESLVTLLQSCSNIKLLHSCDNYEPFEDCFTTPYTGEPDYIVDKIDQEYNEMFAKHLIKNSGCQDRVKLHKKKSLDLVSDFKDYSLDFIWIDTLLTKEQMEQEITAWYPKIKKGGLFSGHDWNFYLLQNFLHEFRKKNNIMNKMSTFDNNFAWFK